MILASIIRFYQSHRFRELSTLCRIVSTGFHKVQSWETIHFNVDIVILKSNYEWHSAIHFRRYVTMTLPIPDVSKSLFDLNGFCSIVTGAGKGIGLTLSQALPTGVTLSL